MEKKLVPLLFGPTVVKVIDCCVVEEIATALEHAGERYLVPVCRSSNGRPGSNSYCAWRSYSDWRP